LNSLDSELSDWYGDNASCESSQPSVEHVLLQKSRIREVARDGSQSKAISDRIKSSAELPIKAADVSLDEEGYKSVAKMNNEQEMLYVVNRVAEENGNSISDTGSLHSVVPYYGGNLATQSFLVLESELSRTSKQPEGWARKSPKKQKATTKHLKLSGKLATKQIVDDEREVEAPSRHKRKDTRQKLSPGKTTKRDAAPTMGHASKDKHVSTGNRKHLDKDAGKKSRARDRETKADASKEHEEYAKNKRHVNDGIDILKDQHESLEDLASAEASEIDETIFAEKGVPTKVK
jgi:hypothetical protein